LKAKNDLETEIESSESSGNDAAFKLSQAKLAYKKTSDAIAGLHATAEIT